MCNRFLPVISCICQVQCDNWLCFVSTRTYKRCYIWFKCIWKIYLNKAMYQIIHPEENFTETSNGVTSITLEAQGILWSHSNIMWYFHSPNVVNESQKWNIYKKHHNKIKKMYHMLILIFMSFSLPNNKCCSRKEKMRGNSTVM